jgi:CRISPR-associated protein Cmr1
MANNLGFRLKTLTPVWTGGVNRHERKLHVTGIKGSIRWWYEVLIRGLGCYCCDPSVKSVDNSKALKCKLDTKKLQNKSGDGKDREVRRQICPACYLFGCTNWSGKFIVRIVDNNEVPLDDLDSSNKSFNLQFIKKKGLEEAEELLLKMTLKLIVDYGAIGGRTTLKPSECDSKNTDSHPAHQKRGGFNPHKDYGIIARDKNSGIPSEPIFKNDNKDKVKKYLKSFESADKPKNDSLWPDLRYFWFALGHCIPRNCHNRIVDRKINASVKGEYLNPNEIQIFLGGFIKEEKRGSLPFPNYDSSSKKIFSFHGIGPGESISESEILSLDDSKREKDVIRCFGYAEENKLEEVIVQITSVIPTLKQEIKRGKDILSEL